jgi:hypothetical protein
MNTGNNLVFLLSGLFIINFLILADNIWQNFNDGNAVFVQESNTPILKSSKVIPFSGINYAAVVNSRDINLNSFTVYV